MTTVDELTRLADCPTCGRPRWVQTKCRCGHSVLVHGFGTRKGATVRTGCSSGDCRCAMFEEAVSDGRS